MAFVVLHSFERRKIVWWVEKNNERLKCCLSFYTGCSDCQYCWFWESYRNCQSQQNPLLLKRTDTLSSGCRFGSFDTFKSMQSRFVCCEAGERSRPCQVFSPHQSLYLTSEHWIRSYLMIQKCCDWDEVFKTRLLGGGPLGSVLLFECYSETYVPLKTHSVCQASAHVCCRSIHEPVTSAPCSSVVSYHLPFNLTENISLRCAIVRVWVGLFCL